MKLHLDRDAFSVLITSVHNRTGIRTDVLEKDYYVVLILNELAEKQKEGLPAYFKGGTALYKSLRTTNRFSEDVDLSVDTRGCTRTQNDRKLEQATKKYKSLSRLPNEGKTNRSEVVSVYAYEPVTVIDEGDELQRFGKLKIEATSFTIGEPVSDLMITPMLYEYASESERLVLESSYDVRPFSVKTITIERIFIDKLFAAEAYTRKSSDPHRAFEAAKHIYDLSVMSAHPQIIQLIKDEKQMGYLVAIRMQEEQGRLDGIPGVKPRDFTFFNELATNEKVRNAYDIMQRQYVFKKEDKIPFKDVVSLMRQLGMLLTENNAWK